MGKERKGEGGKWRNREVERGEKRNGERIVPRKDALDPPLVLAVFFSAAVMVRFMFITSVKQTLTCVAYIDSGIWINQPLTSSIWFIFIRHF